MNQDYFLSLSQVEKNESLSMAPYLVEKLEDFVRRFYYYFLQTCSATLFQFTNMENHYKMFQKSLKLIIMYILDPFILKMNLKPLIVSHSRIQITENNITDFLTSFTLSLKDIYGNQFEDNQINLWTGIMADIMILFRKNLVLII